MSMSKIFAIFIPIFTIIITTLIIVFSNFDKNTNKESNKKAYLFLLGIGILVLIGVLLLLK